MEVAVRPATQVDAPRVAGIHQRSWEEGYRGIVSGRHLRLGRRDGHWAMLLSRRISMETLVAEGEPGMIEGFVTLIARPPYGDEDEHTAPISENGLGAILALYVDPAGWRRGLGKALLRTALEQLQDSGCTSVGVWVLAENSVARMFYRLSGFRPSGTVGTHLPTEAPEIHLRRALAGSGD